MEDRVDISLNKFCKKISEEQTITDFKESCN